MALCRAACLRPFVSLREFGTVVRRPPVTRPPCRPLVATGAAARPPPPPASGAASAAAPAAAAAAAAPAPKYETLTAEQQAQVDAYLDILLDWNTRMNLTGVLSHSPPLSPLCTCLGYKPVTFPMAAGFLVGAVCAHVHVRSVHHWWSTLQPSTAALQLLLARPPPTPCPSACRSRAGPH